MSIDHQNLGVCTDLDAIDRFIEPAGRFFVEAGCGDMKLSRALAERGANVLAIDPDPVQAARNNKAEIIPNVGFVETGAQSIPVESGSIDGVLFPYSLHHVPASLFADVFEEVRRILKKDGFVYVMEPVAAGALNEVMRLFHDESAVRAAAQKALDTFAIPFFRQVTVVEYRIPVHYQSWEDYATRYAGKSYNTNYTEAQVRAESVKQRFHEVGEPLNFHFESPMRVTLLQEMKLAAQA